MEKIVEGMFKVKAVEINVEKPFTWASGIQSPIYCDQRLLLSDVGTRNHLVESYQNQILKDELSDVDAFVGTATSGIPWASFLAQVFEKPLLYVRSSTKDHGKQKKIEGHYVEGMRVIVFEDLISTGGSVLKVCEALKEEGLKVEKVYANFSYGFQSAKQAFKKEKIPYQALIQIGDMLDFAYQQKQLSVKQIQKVENFLKER